MNAFAGTRLAEAILAGLVACLVAGAIYPFLRKNPKGSRGEYVPGWLALGVLTTLVIQATLVLQVAVYWRDWGAAIAWRLPDLQAWLKYELNLIQLVALGGVAVLGSLVTFMVGRLHPRTRRVEP